MQYEPLALGGYRGSAQQTRKDLLEVLGSEPAVPSGMSAPPFIVRIAGLAGDVLEPFSSPACLAQLDLHADLRAALAAARSRLVHLLEEELPHHPPAARRFLLNVKRDCFNGRGLARLAARPEWRDLSLLRGGLVDEVLDLERHTGESERDFELLWERELDRERRHLADVLADEHLLHGIALGSPELVDRARAFRQEPGCLGRREKKVEQSLLRFATRAAAKLSPYSTLTTIGLGTIVDDPDLAGLRFVGGRPREISLVRANRTLLDQCQVVLLRHPTVRRSCRLALNDTARESEPGRWSFLRGGFWEIDGERNSFRYSPAVQVRAELAGPLVDSLRRLLAERALPYEIVVKELQESHAGDRSRICALLEQFVSLGFLCFLPPWRTSELHLERRWLDFLRSLPSDPSLRELEASLDALVTLEEAHPQHPRPESSARDLSAALDRVVERVDALGGGEPARKHGAGFYEDVFSASPAAAAAEGEVVRLSARTAEEMLTCAELVSRFACLFNHRHDLLHTLAAAWAERWPSLRSLGVLDLFSGVQGLWKEYQRFDVTARYDNFSSFNPLELDAVKALNRLRTEVRERTLALMEEHPEGVLLPPRGFAALLDGIPERYRPLLGCSVFVQPTDATFHAWVLNRLFEGSGRYLSRYPAAMEEPMRSRFVSHFAARSVVEVDREPTELLDLMFTHGTMANLRLPQTRRVLEMPGEKLDLPPETRARLSELRIEADLESETFRLVEAEGRRLLPVHLSSLNNAFLPVIQRFLFLFGPYDVRQVFPRPPTVTMGGVTVSQRLGCGNLVVRRKRWEVERGEALGAAAESGAAAFRRLQEWREMNGLPRQVYVYEQMHQNGDPVQSFKPQYIDFSSPSLAGLFLAILRKNPHASFLEEALPAAGEFPLDFSARQRALEIQIDSLALRANTREPHPGVLRKEK
jgi:Lantibiotic dehydratase, N terminus